MARLLFCSVIALAFVAPPALAAPARPAEAFTITNYVVNVRVSEDNIYTVDESISVRFTEPRHGIYRDIPASSGSVRDISVDGSSFAAEDTGDGMRIRIGDAETMAEGDQTYSLRYTLIPAGSAEVFQYYIIGTGWDTTIENVSFSVALPEPFDVSKLYFSLGQAGSTGFAPSDLKFAVDGNTATGSVLRALNPHERLEMRLELPPGYFIASGALAEPSAPDKGQLPVEPDVGVPDGGSIMLQPGLGSFALPGIMIGLFVLLGFGAVVAAIVVIAVVNGRKSPGAGNPADTAMQGVMLNETLLEQQRLQQMQQFHHTDFNPPSPPPPPPDPPSSGGGITGGGGGSW